MDLVDRARRVCLAPGSDRSMRERLVSEIGRHVRFDGHVFAMTDPVSGVVSSPHATLPMVPTEQLPTLIARRYAHNDPEQWLAWLAGEFGVVDVLGVPLRDRFGEWGFLELWRERDGFSERERRTLTALAPVLTTGLRSAVARSFAQRQTAADHSVVTVIRVVEAGVILLGDDLRVRSETDSAAAALMRLLPPDDEVPPVAAVAFNVGAALLAAEQQRGSAHQDRATPTLPWTRVHLGEGAWMTARADRLADAIAVSISPCAADERVDLFARSHGLSPREVEVLALVLRGFESRQIAGSLTIARTTAEDHLRALLRKTGSRSRQHLIVRALGADLQGSHGWEVPGEVSGGGDLPRPGAGSGIQ